MSSTDNTPPAGSTTAAPSTTPTGSSTAAGSTTPTDVTPAASTTSEGQFGTEPGTGQGFPEGGPVAEPQPGWVTRHTTLLTTVMVAVIVAALAIAGLTYYRHSIDERNDDTEAAVTEMIAGQGATLETVECDGDTCAAIIQGQAYTVLVQEDEDGEQHFGVTPFVGD